MVNFRTWLFIVTSIIAIFNIEHISSAPLSAGDQLTLLQPVERVFYRMYCGVWNHMPDSLIKATKPGSQVINRIVASGATSHCLELILKVQYSLPNHEEIKPLMQSKIPIIWVLGGPASGKGSVCKEFAKANSFAHISVGDLLRAEMKSPPNPSIGKVLDTTISQGQLVPIILPMNLLTRKMLSLVGSTKGFLIDGFPRSFDQAVSFQNIVRAPDAIIYLVASEEVMKKRAMNRNEGRSDDNEETFQKRINVFHSQTSPIISSDQFKSKVKMVSSEGSIEVTSRLFSSAINDVVNTLN